MPQTLMLSNGITVLPLMATTVEYGATLQLRIDPYIIGVGPVEAAINTVRFLSDLKTQKSLPDYVILLGSAGSTQLAQGDVYQASSVEYRDMDASAIGFEKGKTPFLDQPARLTLEPQFSFLPSASLSTGASIVVGEGFAHTAADMVDMESYAVKRACQQFDLPLIVLRGISDGKKELQKFDDWTELLPLLDLKLADALDQIFESLIEV
ncbi:5'-methylthioadenosine/S-adenosylhomocysteine nucleosidase [Maritalea mediterranea]|uniref:5'-methylthioadenosine/S-adenosylhomocysteine nucleosidase n=1 Tax=Maritalea mediterranea TaxID=2909667 RepID=A0ABS9EA35_9HYPH|nr:5'-methylthioadenosine/S-adenosylhomocysteine nucleosidase [Maritalea mediterranea]MCF4098311.1 5'-methylthioadenosine/S-adenosylhomocysteine nucleosidase [Maritalea mediterranea]